MSTRRLFDVSLPLSVGKAVLGIIHFHLEKYLILNPVRNNTALETQKNPI